MSVQGRSLGSGLEALAAKNRRDHAFHAAAERLARAASQSPIKGSGSPLKPKLTPAARRFQEEKDDDDERMDMILHDIDELVVFRQQFIKNSGDRDVLLLECVNRGLVTYSKPHLNTIAEKEKIIKKLERQLQERQNKQGAAAASEAVQEAAASTLDGWAVVLGKKSKKSKK